MPSSAFEQLHIFLTEKMRMSHIYQPLMIKTLLEGGGSATAEEIGKVFLRNDQSQIEYYEMITNRMPGPVLKRHGLVAKSGKTYGLMVDTQSLSGAEKSELVDICNKAVESYLEERKTSPWAHRNYGVADIKGSDRYEVMSRAGYRCELCGTPDKVRGLEVDHIIPRKHGGEDSLENYQALCWKCNANKGASDDTDFRNMRAAYDEREKGCLFCEIPNDRIIAENSLAYVIRDGFEVTPLHTLIIPKRHTPTYFDLYGSERNAINMLLDEHKALIEKEAPEVSGFNIGMNSGEDSGQTIFHCHVHLIPRRKGDVEDPRGGVRHIIPGKGSY